MIIFTFTIVISIKKIQVYYSHDFKQKDCDSIYKVYDQGKNKTEYVDFKNYAGLEK